MSGSSEEAGPAGPARFASVLSLEQKGALREVAFASIRHGLTVGRALEPDSFPAEHPFSRPGAVFVTLTREGELRGCVGSFEARRSLILDVARNAYSAAFMDFRFSPVTETDLEGLDLHISLLGPLVPLSVSGLTDLIAVLRPGKDGLLLEDLPNRATFLPQVWDSLPDPGDFVGELFMKAGLPADHWSGTLQFHRYAVEEF